MRFSDHVMGIGGDQFRDGKLYNGFDYERQVWIIEGIVQRCGHPETVNCGCYGKSHAGEREA